MVNVVVAVVTILPNKSLSSFQFLPKAFFYDEICVMEVHMGISNKYDSYEY